MESCLIGVDWGTSRLRLALIDAAGGIGPVHAADAGIMTVTDGAFAPVLARALAALKAPAGLPAVLSGMITSRQGWHEVPYLACPADAQALADALFRVEAPSIGGLHFITGLVCRSEDGLPDVMRGEETQVIGQDDLGPDEALVMPGTHSKWVSAAAGRIERFRSYMTGEVFAVLRQHSILGRLMAEGPEDDAAFRRGVEIGLDGKGLLGRLFSARTLPLTGGLAASGVADYLSGLLVGSEIAEATAAESFRRVVIVGSDALARRYAVALDIAGIAHRPGRPDAAFRGQWLIAKAAGIIR